MKQIESKLKTLSKVWITPVLLIIIAILSITVVSPTTVFAGPAEDTFGKCNDGKDNDRDGTIECAPSKRQRGEVSTDGGHAAGLIRQRGEHRSAQIECDRAETATRE